MKNKNAVSTKITRRMAMYKAGYFFGLAGLTPLLTSCLVQEDSSSTRANTSNSNNWAVGGTALILAGYPEDGMFEDGDFCTEALSSEETLGPCYFASTTGEDISQGKTGLPMQLCIRLIDSNCNPLSGYKIEVWHCDNEGLYSGDTSSSSDSSSFAGDFCTGGDAVAEANTWFRGMLYTNDNGRVNFKTIFPGWYSGRTIHIHVAVVDSDGNRQLITQFCFKDELTEDICTGHSLYSARGKQDTTLSGGKDTVFPIYNYETYLMKTDQNTDGSLLAYHTLQLTDI